jgi:hypothetical protein
MEARSAGQEPEYKNKLLWGKAQHYWLAAYAGEANELRQCKNVTRNLMGRRPSQRTESWRRPLLPLLPVLIHILSDNLTMPSCSNRNQKAYFSRDPRRVQHEGQGGRSKGDLEIIGTCLMPSTSVCCVPCRMMLVRRHRRHRHARSAALPPHRRRAAIPIRRLPTVHHHSSSRPRIPQRSAVCFTCCKIAGTVQVIFNGLGREVFIKRALPPADMSL